MDCLICKGSMVGPFHGYWYECRNCGFMASNLTPAIGDDSYHSMIDEDRRKTSLDGLRRKNFEIVLDKIEEFSKTKRVNLLDVGSAHGWFLKAASTRGHNVTGIEPDQNILDPSQKEGLNIISGFFPDDLPTDKTYEVITFFDVFEHLPDLRNISEACHRRLDEDGLLVLVLPSNRGILFKIARLLDIIGIHYPLNRLWQVGFPSPHLSYFHPIVLENFLQQQGFKEVYRGSLPSVDRDGLWHRLRYDRKSSRVFSSLIWFPLIILSFLLPLLPQDISFQIFTKSKL